MGIIESLGSMFSLAEPEISHFIAHFINWLNGIIGNYGWTVVVFTIILKLVLSPLDIWQKSVMHKNARAMERMKPQIAKLQKQYANNKEMFQQQQLKLYKKEGYSMMGSCLPMIITLVVFFIVFAGFNSMATYMVQMDYYNIYNTYETEYNAVYDPIYNTEYDKEWAKYVAEQADDTTVGEYETIYQTAYDQAIAGAKTPEKAKEAAENAVKNKIIEKASVVAKTPAKEAAEKAVLESYKPNDWLWVKNVFVGDNWKNPIPTYEEFVSNGIDGLRVPQNWVGNDANEYNTRTEILRSNPDYQRWNGYLIMPILTVLVSIGAQMLMKQPTPPGVDSDLNQGKAPGSGVMKFMMPAMMGFFALFYSSAFTIYLLISQLFSLLTSLVYNLIVDRRDKKEEEYRLTHTYK